MNKDDFESFTLRIRCYSAMGRYAEALNIMERLLTDGFLNPELLHWLLVAAEKAEINIKEKARRLYDSYMPVYDKIIDLQDVVNTKTTYDDFGKKQARALRDTTIEQFQSLTAKDALPMPHKSLLEALFAAAAVYEEQ